MPVFKNGVEVGTLGSAKIGSASDYLNISDSGVVTLSGGAKRKLSIRPSLNFADLIRVGAETDIKPTPVNIGAYQGYSLPIYNSDNEELFFAMRVPFRWDGTTDPMFKMIVALVGEEDISDAFQFQLCWESVSITGCLTSSCATVVSGDIIITSGHTAQYSTYSVPFTLDALASGNEIVARNNLSGHVRRIASTATAVSNEIIVLDWITEWQVDKLYGNW